MASKDQKASDSSDSSHSKSLSRRLSSLNIFHRRKKSESKAPSVEGIPEASLPESQLTSRTRQGSFTDYEHISPPLIIPESANVKKDTSRVKRMFKKFFARRGKSNSGVIVVEHGAQGDREPVEDERVIGEESTQDEDEDDFGFKPPESWAVMEPIKETASGKQPAIFDPEKAVTIRIFKPDTRSRSNPNILDNPDTFDVAKFVTCTLICPIDATTSQICAMLANRFFSSRDSGRYRLYLQSNGVERMLKLDEHPCEIQVRMLAEVGFCPQDNLFQLGKEDHKYHFRFVYRELPPSSIPRAGLNEALSTPQKGVGSRRGSISARSAMLASENLAVVPVAIFEFSKSMECIDFSRNPLLELPSDLFETLPRLRVLHLKSNFLDKIPPAILLSSTLTQLSLSSNHLDDSTLVPLAKLTSLKWLDLSGNQITRLPDELSTLSYLTTLYISSNLLTEISPVIFTYTQLRALDISFNRIKSIPSPISSLFLLSTLMAAGNEISSVSRDIENLKFLKDIDLRGNSVGEIDGILQCDSLASIRCDHNNLYTFKNPKLTSTNFLTLSHNKLTSLELSFTLPHLKLLDVSWCQIAVLPDDFFEFLPHLEEIVFDNNELTRVPTSLSSLTSIKELRLSNNRINDLSNLQFEKLSLLERFDIHGNNLPNLPESIWFAESLKYLNVSSNLLITFPQPPPSIDALPLVKTLETLLLAENRLSDEVLDTLQLLTELVTLDLSANKVTDLTHGFETLTKLQQLFLSENDLSSLPEDIGHLRLLKQLHVSDNKLITIPGELSRVSGLVVFTAAANNLRYNIANHPYDWNWSWNIELQALDLAYNPKLEIRSNPQISLRVSIVQGREHALNIGEFKSLSKLHYLDLTDVMVSQNSLPEETTTLRVRAAFPNLSGKEGEVPPVGAVFWCGVKQTFDIFDFQLRQYLGHAKDHLIGLFDGRGSPLVSGLLYDRFDNFLHAELNKLKPEEDVQDALRRAFLWSNADVSNYPGYSVHGASVVIMYTMDQVVYIANTGDAMAVLSRNGTASLATTRHHAWNREEAQRVQSTGGQVSLRGLLMDELDITRAIGYHNMLPAVIACPSIKTFELTDSCEFVVLATQAVWRLFTPQTIVDIVRTCNGDYAFASRRIRDLMIAHGCTSSFSVIVVGLKEMFASSGAKQERRKQHRRPQISYEGVSRLPQEVPPPEGDCAIVFTDIKDSTTLWQMHPAPMRVAIRLHNELARRYLRVTGGYEVKNDGDSFMATFPTAERALRWCMLLQRELLTAEWPQEILDSQLCPTIVHDFNDQTLFRGLSVRIGANFGRPSFSERDPMTQRTDYHGVAVIVAARLEGLAKGGQTLTSDAFFRQLQVEEADLSYYNVVEVGELHLKGLDTPEFSRIVYPVELADRHPLYS